MEQFPQFHFSCSQAQLYAYVKQYEPALYEDIRKWVEEGRWHTTGAMWVESDCNVTSGESLIRQVLYGKRFFREEFGTDPRTCWLPDVFGYPGNMPQILRGSEVDYFMTCKLHWQSTNPFPHHLFWWEGVDGTRILTHIPRLRNYYNGKPEPEQLRFAWDNFREKSVADEVLLPFGYGDGGGGVTPEMLEYLPRAEAMPGLPATRTGGEEEFFDDALAKAADLPVWSGELYLETHRGTYTTQSATKQANRQCEYALRTAELWTSVAAMSGIAADAAPLDEAWRRVLLQQFHDILPGSSIAEVYEDALLDYHRAREAAEVCAAVALESMVRDLGIQGDVVVFNSRGWDRTDPVELLLPTTDSAPAALVGPDGEPLPLQILETGADGHRALVEPRVPVPAMGYAGYRVADTAAPLAENELQAWNRGLESGLFRLEIDENGAVTRLLDKRCGREVIPPGERANDWQFFQDGPAQEAAWNVYATYEKRRYDDPAPARIEVVEQGPVRAALRVTRRFRSSAYTLDIRLYANTPRIDFCAKIDWQERDTMLKVAFPVSVRSAHSTSEIQFGAIERPTHRNTSWEEQKFEIAAQSWVDLSEAGYGVSLMNRERYGHDVHGNRLRLTLLRSADYPDPEADRGSHTFTYSLLPHQGDWTEAQAPWRAAELNDPMRTAPGQGASEDADPRRSFLAFDGLPVVVSALKPASDGNGWILRIYEPHGGRGMTRITVPETIGSVVPCSHVETVRGAALPLHDATVAVAMEPFEIRTFRLA
jgi:alpha-mannosidase